MKNKRGLSQVVTTIILILLIIMAIAGIWTVINRVIIQGTETINTEQFTLDLEIVSAKINISEGIAEVRVKRNQGEGNLTGIKFIIEDSKTTEVIEETFNKFEQLAEKTFTIDLNIPGSDLIIEEITKISIAPIYISGIGVSEQLGSISDGTSNIAGMEEVDSGDSNGEEEPGEECVVNIDCGADYFINGTEVCNDLNDAILQYKKVYTCDLGFCDNENVLTTAENCPVGTTCYNAECISEPIACTNETIETDCGVDGWVGSPGCQTNPEAIIQNYITYSCINNTCESDTNTITKEECNESHVCYEGECFESIECTSNSDCNPGYVCKDSKCLVEEVMNSGTIRSVWPYGIAEYFDSEDLPTNDSLDLKFKYLIFPGSQETRCLQIKEFTTPTSETGISYIRLSQPEANITKDDSYQIWETDYGCTLYLS